MENQSSYQQQNVFNNPINLPNATAVLVLGIVSIVGCTCWGFTGLICSIIALVLAKKDNALYRAAPDQYTVASYNNLKAGRVCAIIGLCLSAVFVLYLIFVISMVGTAYMSDPGAVFRHLH